MQWKERKWDHINAWLKPKAERMRDKKKKNKEQEQQLEKSNQYDRYKSKYINNHFEHWWSKGSKDRDCESRSKNMTHDPTTCHLQETRFIFRTHID